MQRGPWWCAALCALAACNEPTSGPGLEPPFSDDMGGIMNMDPTGMAEGEPPGDMAGGFGDPQAGAGMAGAMQPPGTGVDSGDAAVPDAGDMDAPDAGADAGTPDCDHRHITCKAPEPTCPEYDEVPSVTADGCYGPCVEIGECPCDGPDACPHAEKFTCIHSTMHCSPYL